MILRLRKYAVYTISGLYTNKPPQFNTRKTLKDADLELPESYVQQIEYKYNQIVKGEIKWGKVKKALVAVCYYHVAKEDNLVETKDLKDLFCTSKIHLDDAFKKYQDSVQ